MLYLKHDCFFVIQIRFQLFVLFNFSGKAEVARLLLENGADVNTKGFENRTALFEAACYGITFPEDSSNVERMFTRIYSILSQVWWMWLKF